MSCAFAIPNCLVPIFYKHSKSKLLFLTVVENLRKKCVWLRESEMSGSGSLNVFQTLEFFTIFSLILSGNALPNIIQNISIPLLIIKMRL